MATRDWRHEDRFGSRDREHDRRYGIGRFEQNQFSDDRDRGDDDNRGWFDRVRDTASRWFHRDDDDEREERERFRDDNRPYEQRHSYGGERERFVRGWQDDDNRGRMRRDHDDNRARQLSSYRDDDDDRSGQLDRMHDDRGTLARRGDFGPSGRTRFDRYDERGRFSGFAGEDRRYFGDDSRSRPLGDERHSFEREREYGRGRSWADREHGRYERDRDFDEREMRRDRGPSPRYGQEPQYRAQRSAEYERGPGYERDRGWDRQPGEHARSMRGGYDRGHDRGYERGHDRDDYGRYAPGRQEHVERDDSVRRGTQRLSERSRRR